MKILQQLQKSNFRRKFHLHQADHQYINEVGIDTIYQHAQEILQKRILIMTTKDGRQTPWKGHPVFIAQHATATCCRKCIERWHKVPRNKVLSQKELEYFSMLILEWIERQL